MRSAMMRAATSVDPPGGNGTTSVIWRDGYVCACTHVTPTIAVNASAKTALLMALPPGFVRSLVWHLFTVAAAVGVENASMSVFGLLAALLYSKRIEQILDGKQTFPQPQPLKN
jgi:hypothetical protein